MVPLNIVRSNVHVDQLVLKNNLVVECDVASNIVFLTRRRYDLETRGGELANSPEKKRAERRTYGKLALEIFSGELSNHCKAFATRTCKKN